VFKKKLKITVKHYTEAKGFSIGASLGGYYIEPEMTIENLVAVSKRDDCDIILEVRSSGRQPRI